MTVAWSPRAIRHLSQLREYIAWDNPAAAARSSTMILQAVERAAEYPGIGRAGRIPGTRELVVSGTSYVIPYRVRGERFEILAVFHGRQKWPVRIGLKSDVRIEV